MKQSLYEQNGGTYCEENGHLIPNLALPESNEQPIGKYGLIHLNYLKKHRRGIYTTLLTEGRLNAYLADVDRQAKEMLDLIITQTAEREGVTEELKAVNQMEWVSQMNNIFQRSIELLNSECGLQTQLVASTNENQSIDPSDVIPKIFWKYYDLFRRQKITLREYAYKTGLSTSEILKYYDFVK